MYVSIRFNRLTPPLKCIIAASGEFTYSKIIAIIVLSALALAAAALLSSGCADSLIMGDDFGIGEFTGCSYDAFQGWSESVESDGYVHTIKNILVDAKDKAIFYYNTR